VLFGAPPFFHEDDETRAVACALALLEVAERHQLQVRIGLTTGPLFAGPLGAPQRREYTVIGDMVNLAARLMQQANPGEVWVDQSVHSRTERYFEFEDLGQIQVKGKTGTRHAYRALGEKDQEELVMGYLLSNQELTGRDAELAVVDELSDSVWDRRGQVLLLNGEAGVGKSRLAAEIVRRWTMRGGASHGGDCVSYGRQTPYLPWRGVIASIAGLSPRLPVSERLARLESLLRRLPVQTNLDATATASPDYWLERLPLLADMLGLESEETHLTGTLSEDLRRDNIFAIVRAIILHEARQRPTLVLLEDTHWSDELSLELAVYLADEIHEQPIFLVLAHRPLSVPIPISYQKLHAKPFTFSIGVSELSPDAALKLVKSKLGVKQLPSELAELIKMKGQGNPFFIEELVNSLLSMNVINIQEHTCHITGDLSGLELPNTVQKVVLARIDQLDEADKVTLKVAAAIGRTFQRDLLETVHPWVTTETSLTEQLARLQAEDFTRQEVNESDLDFLFKHVITQEVAYETMLYSQRRKLHATIGAALEQRSNNNDGEIIDLLAYHYARSDERRKALHYLQKAGQKALSGYANEAAISYFNEALAVAEELHDVSVQFDLLAGREQAYNRLGNRIAQDQDLKLMKQLALSENNILQQLDVNDRWLQLFTNLGHYHEAIALAKETLALARRHQRPLWEARILTHLGITDWRQGDYEQARHYLQQAVKRLDAQDDPRLRATNLNYLGLIHSQLSEYEQARQDYQQALDLYRQSGDRAGEAGCANNLGLLESSLGRYSQAQQFYNQALSICHTIGNRLREGISLNTLGQVESVLGNFDRARELLQRSLTIRLAIGDRRGEAFCMHDLGHLHLLQQQLDDAIDYFGQARDIRRELGETGNYVASLAALGEAYLQAGALSKAVSHLEEAIGHMRQGTGSGEYPPQNIWWAFYRLCHRRDDNRQMAEALRQAQALVQQKAEAINDPDLRRSYLENVQTNAAIINQVNIQQQLISQ
ncbi:MAG: tetratricopeptide repeat protein, partial [Anaerolineae bacterium]|nr:tetratricopeptide repeat protein [Anaerolineae bacterium]